MFRNFMNNQQISKNIYKNRITEIREYYALCKYAYIKEFIRLFYSNYDYATRPKVRIDFEQFMMGRSFKNIPEFMDKIEMMYYYHKHSLHDEKT